MTFFGSTIATGLLSLATVTVPSIPQERSAIGFVENCGQLESAVRYSRRP